MAMKKYFFLFLFSVSAVSAAPPPAVQPPAAPLEGLLANGDFEQGPKPQDIKNRVLQSPHALPRWEINGVVEYITGGHQPDGTYIAVSNGAHGVRLGAGASVSQTVPVKNGSHYALTFGASRTCAEDQVLRVSVPPESGDLPLQMLYSSGGSDAYAWGFRAYSDYVTVAFQNPAILEDDDPTCGPLVDAVAINELFLQLPTPENLVKNSGFEEGPDHLLINSTQGLLLPPKDEDCTSPLPSWIIESVKAVKLIDSCHYRVPEGRSAVELIAGEESAIAQVIRTVPDTTYTLAFVVGDAANGCHGNMMVEASAAKEAMKAAFKSEGKGEFKTFSFQFTAESNRTRICFFSSSYHTKINDPGTLCGPVVDLVRVVSAPMV